MTTTFLRFRRLRFVKAAASFAGVLAPASRPGASANAWASAAAGSSTSSPPAVAA